MAAREEDDELEVSDLTSRLDATSIEELLRIQDKLQRLVRDRYEKPVAVLFSDIAGSTAYFERYGDTEGRRMIQRHNDLLIPVIEQRGGRVVKTIGDALMATFPSANLAADAACEMMRAVAEANARVSHEEERFEIRIGINFGTALVNDKDGDVYGDMVNVAARVQTQAEKGQILVSEQVREHLSPTVPIRPRGTFLLKGKSLEQPLFELQWKKHARSDATQDRPNLGARYVVLDLLGTGGMASVWRARDEKLGRDVAVKVVHGHMRLSFETRERFSREAVVAASLVHDNIVQVYDYASDEAPQSFIAMELVDGRQLREWMAKRGRVPEVAALLVGHEVARGLAHAHGRGVVHRDLKPENILVSDAGTVKVADFGIAGVEEMVRLTQSGAQLGTPAYLAPEQVKGSPATQRSDVFALGVVLYEMIAGRSPFAGESAAAIMYRIMEGTFAAPEELGVGRDVAALLRRCLAKEPKERFAHAGEVAEALSQALAARQVGDPRSSLARYVTSGVIPGELSTAEALRALRPRGRGGLFAGLAGGVLLVVMLGWWFVRDLGAGQAKVPAGPGPVQVVRELSPAAPPPPEPDPAPVAEVVAERPKPKAEAVPAPSAPAAVVPVRATRPAAAPRPSRAPPPQSPQSTGAVASSGTLKLVVSGGWANVSINGEAKGRYPSQRLFTLPVGEHRLELSGNAARAPYLTTVRVEPGRTLEHRVTLQPAAGQAD